MPPCYSKERKRLQDTNLVLPTLFDQVLSKSSRYSMYLCSNIRGLGQRPGAKARKRERTLSKLYAMGRPCTCLPMRHLQRLLSLTPFNCSFEQKSNLFPSRIRSSPRHTLCCKLMLDKQPKLDMEASFRDTGGKLAGAFVMSIEHGCMYVAKIMEKLCDH